jgi:prepilin-type processing-associated H-X9-DG protein
VFYCPERSAAPDSNYVYKQELWTDPPTKKTDISYLYRMCDDSGNGDLKLGPPYDKQRNQLPRLKLGKLRLKDKDGKVRGDREIALTADLMGTRDLGSPDADWAHARPWGANVGFSDGHAEWIVVPEAICLIPRTKWGSKPCQNVPMKYIWLMFYAFDSKDFSDVAVATYP